MSGLVLATWVQSLWAWRPRIDVLGATNTGKSMLCAALAGLIYVSRIGQAKADAGLGYELIAIAAPAPRNGSIAWAASPSRVTRPFDQPGSGVRS